MNSKNDLNESKIQFIFFFNSKFEDFVTIPEQNLIDKFLQSFFNEIKFHFRNGLYRTN